jgi:hydroxymethylglutaryl-CoA lyase
MQIDYPLNANVVEVGPRDGLQNEKQPLQVADKVNLINTLSRLNGYPKWLIQMR